MIAIAYAMNTGANVEVQNDENQHGECQAFAHTELDNQSLKAIMNHCVVLSRPGDKISWSTEPICNGFNRFLFRYRSNQNPITYPEAHSRERAFANLF